MTKTSIGFLQRKDTFNISDDDAFSIYKKMETYIKFDYLYLDFDINNDPLKGTTVMLNEKVLEATANRYLSPYWADEDKDNLIIPSSKEAFASHLTQLCKLSKEETGRRTEEDYILRSIFKENNALPSVFEGTKLDFAINKIELMLISVAEVGANDAAVLICEWDHYELASDLPWISRYDFYKKRNGHAGALPSGTNNEQSEFNVLKNYKGINSQKRVSSIGSKNTQVKNTRIENKEVLEFIEFGRKNNFHDNEIASELENRGIKKSIIACSFHPDAPSVGAARKRMVRHLE
jgi:hypothetical protein